MLEEMEKICALTRISGEDLQCLGTVCSAWDNERGCCSFNFSEILLAIQEQLSSKENC